MGVCIVENLSSVFLSEWPPLHLWVMMVYIVWMKGKKVTLKNPSGRESRMNPLTSGHMLLTCTFRGNPSCELLAS